MMMMMMIIIIIIIIIITQVKKQQQRIEMVLGNQYKTYEVEYVDTAASEEAKKKMRDLMGDPKGLPPQIFRGDKYLGVRELLECYFETVCKVLKWKAIW